MSDNTESAAAPQPEPAAQEPAPAAEEAPATEQEDQPQDDEQQQQQQEEEGEAAEEEPLVYVRDPTERELALLAELEGINAEIAVHDEEIEHDTQLIADIREKLAANEENVTRLAELQQENHDLAARQEQMEGFILKFGDIDVLEQNINNLEETVAADTLSHIWQSTLDTDDVAKLDRSAVVVDELESRVGKVLNHHEHLVYQISELLVKCDQQKNLATLEQETAMRQLDIDFQKEVENLKEIRKHLKSHETEQKFHIHRGTYIKDKPKESKKHIHAGREADLHSQVSAAIVVEKGQKEFLEGEVGQLEKEHAAVMEENKKERDALQAKIDEVRAGYDEVEWNCQVLEVEHEDLMAVKKDILDVTIAIKNSRKF